MAASNIRVRNTLLGRAEFNCKSARPKNARKNKTGGPNLGDHETGTLWLRAVVVTETAAVTGVEPVGVSELGVTEQEAAAGAPVQLSVIG